MFLFYVMIYCCWILNRAFYLFSSFIAGAIANKIFDVTLNFEDLIYFISSHILFCVLSILFYLLLLGPDKSYLILFLLYLLWIISFSFLVLFISYYLHGFSAVIILLIFPNLLIMLDIIAMTFIHLSSSGEPIIFDLFFFDILLFIFDLDFALFIIFIPARILYFFLLYPFIIFWIYWANSTSADWVIFFFIRLLEHHIIKPLFHFNIFRELYDIIFYQQRDIVQID